MQPGRTRITGGGRWHASTQMRSLQSLLCTGEQHQLARPAGAAGHHSWAPPACASTSGRRGGARLAVTWCTRDCSCVHPSARWEGRARPLRGSRRRAAGLAVKSGSARSSGQPSSCTSARRQASSALGAVTWARARRQRGTGGAVAGAPRAAGVRTRAGVRAADSTRLRSKEPTACLRLPGRRTRAAALLSPEPQRHARAACRTHARRGNTGPATDLRWQPSQHAADQHAAEAPPAPASSGDALPAPAHSPLAPGRPRARPSAAPARTSYDTSSPRASKTGQLPYASLDTLTRASSSASLRPYSASAARACALMA